MSGTTQSESSRPAGRRRFLCQTIGALATGSAFPAMAAVSVSGQLPGLSAPPWADKLSLPDLRTLHIANIHTGEHESLAFWINGRYDEQALQQVDYLMRDYRADVVKPMDLSLLDLLYALQWKLGTHKPIQVLSGYRTPQTNAMLRRRSGNVAKYSLHMEARAADIRMSDVPLKQLHAAARELGVGGVGLYTRSNFVHVDTGRVRHWGS